MKFTSVFVALAAATVVSAARFNMAPLNLRNETLTVREIHPTVVERDVAPRNETVAKRAVAFGSTNSTLAKN